MASLLFDLDGTLTDPGDGITRSIQYAVGELRRPVPERASLVQFVGPPLRDSFAALLDTNDGPTLDRAIHLYRQRYGSIGLYENAVYEFIVPGLKNLREAGHRMWVATSKPTEYAETVIDHFGLGSWFERIYGSEMSGARSAKTELVAHVLAREGLDPRQTWMIGDRSHDIIGGVANRTHTAGALWGYGSSRELSDAGAEILIDGLAALSRHLSPSNTGCTIDGA